MKYMYMYVKFLFNLNETLAYDTSYFIYLYILLRKREIQVIQIETKRSKIIVQKPLTRNNVWRLIECCSRIEQKYLALIN